MKYVSLGDITKMAFWIISEIKEQSVSDIWPTHVEQSDKTIPKSITHLLHTMLTGDHDQVNISERVECLTNSLGSDMITDTHIKLPWP